jgi:SAM-dependent methyltransferase
VSKKVLVTGASRSGTAYVSHILSHSNIELRHEGIHRHDGDIVSSWDLWDGDVSWAALYNLDKVPSDVHVVQLVRHPLKTMRSLAERFAPGAKVSVSWVKRMESLFPRMRSTEDLLGKAAIFWVEANRLAASVANERVKIEDVDPNWVEHILKTCGKEWPRDRIERLFERTRKTINTNVGEIVSERMPLPKLEDIPEPVRDEVVSLMKEYGYQEHEPSNLPSVSIAIPNRGWLHMATALQVFTQLWQDPRFIVHFDHWSPQPVDVARNTQCKAFLERGDDFLLFMDSDNPVASGKNPLDNIPLDLDIVVYPTPMWKMSAPRFVSGSIPMLWNGLVGSAIKGVYRPSEERVGLKEIDAGGTGCMLIARRVIEAVQPPFIRKLSDDGTAELGSDIYFCERAREKGFKVWCDWTRPCDHFKEINLTSMWVSMWARDISQMQEMDGNINTEEHWNREWEKRPELEEYPEPLALIVDHIKKICDGKRVLDFGCGRGELLRDLKEVAASVKGIDLSEKAVECCREQGLDAEVGTEPTGEFDVIVATQVLEHLDDDKGMLEKMLELAPTVLYTVPNNCLPPRIEKEHRRVYTHKYIREMTPSLKEIHDYSCRYLVIAERKETTDGKLLCESGSGAS